MYWHGMEKSECPSTRARGTLSPVEGWKKYPGCPKTDKDWKRCRAWIVRKLFPPSRRELRSPRFANAIARIFRQLFLLYAFTAIEGRRGGKTIIGRQL